MTENMETPSTEKPKKNNKVLIIVVVAIALCCCCVIGTFVFYQYLGDPLIELLGV